MALKVTPEQRENYILITGDIDLVDKFIEEQGGLASYEGEKIDFEKLN